MADLGPHYIVNLALQNSFPLNIWRAAVAGVKIQRQMKIFVMEHNYQIQV